jgi:uncharacterized protein (DUF302 family)
MIKRGFKFSSMIGIAGLLVMLFALPSFAEANKHLAIIYTIKGDKAEIEAKYNKFVEETINGVDFRLSDPHKRVNDAYKKKYGSTKLDILSFMSISNEKVVKPMFNVDPRIAGFAPFNMLIYRSLADDTTKVGHIMPEAMLDIIGISDTKLRADFIKSFEPLDKLIKEELGGEVSYIDFKKMAEKRMMNFEVEFDAGMELDDVIDEFQEQFEEKFEENKYIIAGFLNLKETDGEDTIPEYDAFWSYSLCHFKFSYTVFDNEGGRPEAGLFAPCTMYMYIKKGSNKIVVGMPRLENWSAMLGMKGERAELAAKLDIEIPSIMKELGAIETENVNPLLAVKSAPKKEIAKVEKPKAVNTIAKKVAAVAAATVVATAPVAASKIEVAKKVVSSKNQLNVVLPKIPEVPVALKVVTIGGTALRPREQKTLSTAIPLKVSKPSHSTTIEKPEESGGATDVGMTKNGRVSAYLRGAYMEATEVSKKLTDAGFKILSTSTVDKKGLLTTIVFTNDVLSKLADKKDRGFMGSLRVLIDNDNKQFTISNPLYFSRAYMQDEHDEKLIIEVLLSINNAFGGLKSSKDFLKYTLLPKYQFMFAMPYYEDMIEVGEAGNSQKLLEKIKQSKSLVFTQVLSKDRILVGVNLGKRTSKFIGKVGTHNALLLPYPILLENGVAKILDPKYYIAVSYPMLKMSQFMKISTVPGAIEKDCKKLFK